MWKKFYNSFKGRFCGEKALHQTAEQNRIDRYFTFPNFERSAERCGEEMRRAGLSDVTVEEFPADGKTNWSGWKAMKAWDVEYARLWMVSPHKKLLQDWQEIPQSLVMYSGPADEELELVEWNGTLNADLKGKLPLTGHSLIDVSPQMRALGVKGIISDFIGTLPGIRDAFDLPDGVRWENHAILSAHGKCWGFMITPRQGAMLRELMKKGAVRLKAEIKSRIYEGIFKSATGVIKGSERPDEEVLFVTHLYEPGANDNSSGDGVGLELAHSLNGAIEKGVVPRPRRSIRFLFNWEGFGLYAWLHKHAEKVPKILGGLNIDEIGVDQFKGRSIVHLFKPPAANPSCVGHLIEKLCDGILSPGVRWKGVADRMEIINDTNCSDPNMDIPLPSLIQYPSCNYHTSMDALDSLSTEVMEKIGLVTATQLYFLANMGSEEARWLSRVVAASSRNKLQQTELQLLEKTWPFGAERTRDWFAGQFLMSSESLVKFGLEENDRKELQGELTKAVESWYEQWKSKFPPEPKRKASPKDLERAKKLVLQRTTLGSPNLYSLDLDPEEYRKYRETLYRNNLDMMQHRICYWASGKRTFYDIIQSLEFEAEELSHDTSISRTSSGAAIEKASVEINLEAALYLVDLLVRNGYLKESGTVHEQRLGQEH